MSQFWPRTLFGRTALLIAALLAFFALIAWLTLVWTTLIPAAEVTAHLLAQRTRNAAAAYEAHTALPEGVLVSDVAAPPEGRKRMEFSMSLYLNHLRSELRADLPGADVLISRSMVPSAIWVRLPEVPNRWFILRWRVARPGTPFAMGLVVLLSAFLALIAAAWFARRLNAPLASLADAAHRIGEGEVAKIDTESGPSEVRSLAVAFQAMSLRLAALHEQRELMLAGLSHDLRSPLARMRVAVDLLSSPEPELHEQIAMDVEEIDRMVGQFMQYVRAGYREKPSVASPDQVVRQALAPFLGNQQVHVHLELDADEARLIPVDCVRRVVVNLVQNALEYGKPPVTVRTRNTSSQLTLTVEDCGEGLTPEEWQQAVQPFRRLRATPGEGHSGLGLATATRLIHAVPGTLTSQQSPGGFQVEVVLKT